jgi:hypothetical protein
MACSNIRAMGLNIYEIRQLPNSADEHGRAM